MFDLNSSFFLGVFFFSSVQVTKFMLDNLHVMSGSDDRSVVCWDIATGQSITTFKEHEVNLPMVIELLI